MILKNIWAVEETWVKFLKFLGDLTPLNKICFLDPFDPRPSKILPPRRLRFRSAITAGKRAKGKPPLEKKERKKKNLVNNHLEVAASANNAFGAHAPWTRC